MPSSSSPFSCMPTIKVSQMYHYLQLSVLLVTILSGVATAERWSGIGSSGQWNGLLDPLDIDVRRTVIRYGELAQATSDAFIGDPASPYAGSSRYGPSSFFYKVQASDPGAYRVTRFIYAMSADRLPDGFMTRPAPEGAWSTESNWMGYVAVATDVGAAALGRRDIVVAWRATRRTVEWVSDLDFVLVPAAGIVGPGSGWSQPSVHRGFLSVYMSKNPTSRFNKQSAREQVLAEVRRLLDTYKNENCSITLTGHSLGAALSTLNAVDLVANGLNVRGSSKIPVPVTAILFGCPRVGDDQFKKAFDSMAGLSLLRVRNALDIVPTILPSLFYRDVGAELLVDTRKSPYLKDPAGPAQWHNLECYLHAVAGTQGAGDGAGFKLEVDRDVALVNKDEDALKDEYPVPARWWAESNKGMVKNATGHWVLNDHEEGNLAL